MSIEIYHGDCRDLLPYISDVDAVVTDPPYGLNFMGKGWDHGVPGREYWEWVLDSMKPGAHLLAFGGTRTFHRLTCAIEDAGFEIRDCLMWVYGSGFPKSHNVGNHIDRSKGCSNRGHAIASGSKFHPTTGKARSPGENLPKYEGRTPEGKQWEGWGTALKPAWEPIIMARKPVDGTVANNTLKHGVGGLNIDGCRVELARNEDLDKLNARSGGQRGFQDSTVYGTGKPLAAGCDLSKGRWPANLIHDGSDEVVELFPETGKSGDSQSSARFFYCSKVSKKERGEGNNHPTVKPLALMRYLCRLVTPPGGLILDPFVGSGSTLLAAQEEGFRGIGIDIEKSSCEIAGNRLGCEVSDPKARLIKR